MKYIKQYEELKSTTYKNASARLSKKHPTRSKELSTWGDVVRGREIIEEERLEKIRLEEEAKKRKEDQIKEWKDNIKRYSPFGTFKLKLDPKWDSEGQPRYTGEFYIAITHYREYLLNGDCDQNSNTGLILELAIIPKDLETYNDIKNIEYDGNSPYFINIGRIDIGIKLKEYDFELDEVGIGFDDMEDFHSSVEIADRPNALRFKRLLKDIFTNRNYPDNFNKDRFSSLYSNIDATLAESGISSDFGLSMEDFEKKIDKVTVNQLYKS